MNEINTFLLNKLSDRDDLNNTVLSKYLKCSIRQISNIKNRKRDLTFRNILILTQLVDKENYKEHIRRWAPNLDSDDCIRGIFEYAAITRDVELLDSHIKYCKKYEKDTKKSAIKKYIKVYSFIRDCMKGLIEFTRMEEELDKLKNIGYPKLKILVEIFYCVALLHKREFSYVLSKASEIEKQIKKMDENKQLFVKECYLYRISEVLAFAHLFMNNLKGARHYSYILLNASINKRVDSDALYILGMTYLLDDEKKCLHYLKRSILAAKETRVDHLVSFAVYNYNFAKILLNKEIDDDAPEVLKCFQSYRDGKTPFNAAERAVKEMNDPDLTDYFESIISEEAKYKKFCYFVSNSNLYYASIIVRDLMDAGEDAAFIRNLTKNLRKTSEGKGDVLFEEDFISCFIVGSRGIRDSCA